MAVIGHPDSRWFSALSEDDLLGIIGYHGINWIDGTAEIFTALAPEWRGKGFALPLVKRQIETGFQDLGLRRLTMTALEGSPSAKLAAKMGVAPEGRHPRTRLKRGTYHDSLTFGLERKP
jgi:RimJ/RimL family protein N-acetyltransferase